MSSTRSDDERVVYKFIHNDVAVIVARASLDVLLDFSRHSMHFEVMIPHHRFGSERHSFVSKLQGFFIPATFAPWTSWHSWVGKSCPAHHGSLCLRFGSLASRAWSTPTTL